MTKRTYRTARDLRRALEDRLKRRAAKAGLPLDRLRKQVAHERLLARLQAVAPEDAWALKGGLALILRLGDDARATRDVDATWRRSRTHWDQTLEAVRDADVDDFFGFEIREPQPLSAETDEGGLRYPIVARLDGRVFERIRLDVNLVNSRSAAGRAPRVVESARLRRALGA